MKEQPSTNVQLSLTSTDIIYDNFLQIFASCAVTPKLRRGALIILETTAAENIRDEISKLVYAILESTCSSFIITP
jgi:hypothetical protein